jgi:hypothetical protein
VASSDVFTSAFEAIRRRFHLTLEDITREQLAYRPHPEANSIAWLGWHLTRWQDAQVSRFAGRDQAWVGGWAEKFGRPADPLDTGLGHSSADVAGLSATAELLMGYHDAVFGRTVEYLRNASEGEMERQVHDERRGADTVRGRLVGVLSDNFQHVGQMAYLRGLMAGAHWGAH